MPNTWEGTLALDNLRLALWTRCKGAKPRLQIKLPSSSHALEVSSINLVRLKIKGCTESYR